MGRKSRLKRRKHATLDAHVEGLVRAARSVREGRFALDMALGAAVATGATEATRAADAVLEDVEEFRYGGYPESDSDVALSCLLGPLGESVAALEAALAEEGLSGHARQKAQIALLTGQTALFAKPSEVALAGERASRAIRLASRVLPKRELPSLFEAIGSLLAESRLTSCCCCPPSPPSPHC